MVRMMLIKAYWGQTKLWEVSRRLFLKFKERDG